MGFIGIWIGMSDRLIVLAFIFLFFFSIRSEKGGLNPFKEFEERQVIRKTNYKETEKLIVKSFVT